MSEPYDDDRRLAVRWLRGDETAFEHFFDTYSAREVPIVFVQVRHRDETAPGAAAPCS